MLCLNPGETKLEPLVNRNKSFMPLKKHNLKYPKIKVPKSIIDLIKSNYVKNCPILADIKDEIALRV